MYHPNIAIWKCNLGSLFQHRPQQMGISTPIEKIHSQLLEGILGLNRSTTNILVRAYILNRNINYIKYVENKCNTTLVKQALTYEPSKMECRPAGTTFTPKS